MSDARVPEEYAAFPKWDAGVKKWAEQASELGMVVEFNRKGSSEVLERLASQSMSGGPAAEAQGHPIQTRQRDLLGNNMFFASYNHFVFNESKK